MVFSISRPLEHPDDDGDRVIEHVFGSVLQRVVEPTLRTRLVRVRLRICIRLAPSLPLFDTRLVLSLCPTIAFSLRGTRFTYRFIVGNASCICLIRYQDG